jgi:hypothetical protein
MGLRRAWRHGTVTVHVRIRAHMLPGCAPAPDHAPKWSLEAVAGEGGAGADGSRVCALRTLPTTAARWSYTLPPVASLVFCAQSPLHAVSLAGRWRMRKPPTSAPRTALQRGGRLSHALERSSQRYRSTAGERGDACCPPAGRQSPPHWTCPSSSRAKWSETRPLICESSWMTAWQARWIFVAVVVGSTLYYVRFQASPFPQDD